MEINPIKFGIYTSIIAWCVSWTILVFKLDTLTYIGFMLFGFGLNGIIIFIFVPEVIKIRVKRECLNEE